MSAVCVAKVSYNIYTKTNETHFDKKMLNAILLEQFYADLELRAALLCGGSVG